MKSMTGYGHAVLSNSDYLLEVEIKSYNGKYLEIVHNMHYFFTCLEAEIDEKIKNVCSRGHVELGVRLKEFSSPIEVVINKEAVKAYKQAFSQLEDEIGIKPAFSDYSRAEGLIDTVKTGNIDDYKTAFFTLLDEALDGLRLAKEREGEGTRSDLKRLINDFNSSLSKIKDDVSTLEAYLRKTLEEKIRIARDDFKIDDDRLYQEIALLLVKFSISEELNRLDIHIREYERLLSLEEPVGKRLDFLCQEMNRETNTIASKSQIARINMEVVRMKDTLENIREQVRNIE